MTLATQVLDFIEQPRSLELESLLLAVFADQFERIAPYRSYCLGLGVSPATVRAPADIPPASTAAFKHAILSGRPNHAQRVFITSGTSRGEATRGRHFIASLDLYRASALAHMRRMLFPDGRRISLLALHPTADLMPQSSLSQMLTWAFEAFGADPSLCCATPRGLDAKGAARFLAAAQTDARPVGLLGTTAAFAALFEFLRGAGIRLALTAGSRLMDTGGAKGQAIPLSSEGVLVMAREHLGIAPELAINEYGMTELCSQLYDATPYNAAGRDFNGPRVKLAPPWLQVQARDPVTMRPLPPGEPGLLCFFDLANANSISALMTEDLGTVLEDGAVLIHGRALAADPRGCALGIEQFGAATPARSADSSGVADQLGACWEISVGAGELRARAIQIARAPRQATTGRLMAQVLAAACDRWRCHDYPPRRAAIAATAAAGGQSGPLLEASLDALLTHFRADNLMPMAARLATTERLIGLIMPGNVMGAGLHELVQALIAGAGVIVKIAATQPFFYPAFARTIAAINHRAGERLAVLNWRRGENDRTAALADTCDAVAAFGNDDTIAILSALIGAKLIDFGARLSIGLVAREGMANAGLAAAVARDVALFDQRGCLSMHHLFVEAEAAQGRAIATEIARQLDSLGAELPAALPGLMDAASARAVREDARWRMIGGDGCELWSSAAGLQWSVIFDPGGKLTASPLCRTLRVSTFADFDDLMARLSGFGAIEGVALADPNRRLNRLQPMLRRLGVSYFCTPGELQSPPPDWAHGGGHFLARLGISGQW